MKHVVENRAGPNDGLMLQEVDRLIQRLESACSHLEATNHPGLVELQAALDGARRLKSMIHCESDARSDRSWSDAVRILMFVLDTVEKLYSIVFYIQPQMVMYEFWVDHKAAPHCRRRFPGRIRREAQCVTSLLVDGGEWQERAGARVTQNRFKSFGRPPGCSFN